MTKQKKQPAGAICLVTGGLLMIIGIIRLLAFVHRIQDYKALSAVQLFRLLVVPHILLLAGFGLITAAFVLFKRRAIIRKRQQQG